MAIIREDDDVSCDYGKLSGVLAIYREETALSLHATCHLTPTNSIDTKHEILMRKYLCNCLLTKYCIALF